MIEANFIMIIYSACLRYYLYETGVVKFPFADKLIDRYKYHYDAGKYWLTSDYAVYVALKHWQTTLYNGSIKYTNK